MANTDFTNALNLYRQNLTEYKVTGNSAFKTAAENAKTWLDAYIKNAEDTAKAQVTTINQFVANYETTNPDLIAIQGRAREIREDGPKLQDVYETEMKAQEEEPVDYTTYYIKVGLIAGVGAMLGVLAFF